MNYSYQAQDPNFALLYELHEVLKHASSSGHLIKDVLAETVDTLIDKITQNDSDGFKCVLVMKLLSDAIKVKPLFFEENFHKYLNKLKTTIIKKASSAVCLVIFATTYAQYKPKDIGELEDAVIQKDPTGYCCYEFAKYIPNANIRKLEDAVIAKDEYGDICESFANKIPNANVEKLIEAAVKKRRKLFGEKPKSIFQEMLNIPPLPSSTELQLGYNAFTILFDLLNKGLLLNESYKAKIKELIDKAVQSDPTGMRCYSIICLILNRYGIATNKMLEYIKRLESAIIEKDATGSFCLALVQLFVQYGFQENIQKLQQAVIEKDATGVYTFAFTNLISQANIN